MQLPVLLDVLKHNSADLGPRLWPAPFRWPCDAGLRLYQVAECEHDPGDDGNPKCIRTDVLNRCERADDREHRYQERKYKYPL